MYSGCINLTSCVNSLLDQARQLSQNHNLVPHLAVIETTVTPASKSYLRAKEKKCRELGWEWHHYRATSYHEAREILAWTSTDPTIDAIIVQLPLASFIPDKEEFISLITPEKDVENITGKGFVRPPFPHALVYAGLYIRPDARSYSLSMSATLSSLMRNEIKNQNLHWKECSLSEADIVFSATGGSPRIQGNMLKEDSAIIDGGVEKNSENKWEGDFENATALPLQAWTPVPGGIGPLTTAALLKNVALIAKRRKEMSHD